MPICGKHDVRFAEGDKCWCCQLLEDTERIPVNKPEEKKEEPKE